MCEVVQVARRDPGMFSHVSSTKSRGIERSELHVGGRDYTLETCNAYCKSATGILHYFVSLPIQMSVKT